MPQLVRYAAEHAEPILRWPARAHNVAWWFGLTGDEKADRSRLDRWLAEEGNDSYILLDATTPIGYGELWREPDEVELAHLMVDPRRQGQGFGARLVRELTALARQDPDADIFLRVQPDNAVAISCYRRCDYVRMSPREEAEFNAGQPQRYVWMRPSTR
ncbi:MAG TPA: GNAT family N-acetyltransferase [Nocardioidaceae bacterium]|nr:GNAT family N-acetyltransferase [Nocardioidaceae bacterium]